MAIFFAFFENFFWRTKWIHNCEFSAHIYSYLEHTLKFVQSEIVSHCWTIRQLSHSSLKNFLRWPRLQAFCSSKPKKSNGILICEIRNSLWTRIIKKCWKLNFRYLIEYSQHFSTILVQMLVLISQIKILFNFSVLDKKNAWNLGHRKKYF